ncbi:uncharacterized protein LOC134235703 isoform X2 [Saccostrea cucullata]|uniref:uncharacterized protein LOC134235703 isoform X2 n=1 Tax=Saccostrea cuccullata TaxID=36930 RepID=UPI002ED14867
MGSVMWQTCCIVGKQAVMICANHICLEVLFCLMMTVWNAGAIENDTEPENSLHKTIRKLTEVWNSSCTSDLLNTNRSDNVSAEVEKIRCLNGMEPVSESKICLFWNISVVVDGKECNVFSRANCHLDEEIKKMLINTTKSSSTGVSDSVDNEGRDVATAEENYSILVLTHLIAVAIGAGLLYCVLFVKKVKRKLKNIGKIREERNRETNCAYISHSLQKGSTGSTSSPCLIPDEDVYCEVADKVQHDSSQFVNFSYSVADNSVLGDRKNTRLPDIPQQTMKDDNQYLTPISRSLPHEYLDSSGMAIKEKDENETWSEDGTIQESEVLSNIDSLNDSLDTETIDNYFVLEKSTDMDLK